MRLITKNSRAYRDYDITSTYTAGIVLQGQEVKAIKTQSVNIQNATAHIIDGALRLDGMDIPVYKKAPPHTVIGYHPQRRRKLLLHQRELARISAALDKKGMVLIPLEIWQSDRGWIKCTLGLGKLRKKIEKKHILKEKDIQRQAERELKEFI